MKMYALFMVVLELYYYVLYWYCSFNKLFEILDDSAIKLTLGIKNDLAYSFSVMAEHLKSIYPTIHTHKYRNVESESLSSTFLKNISSYKFLL